MAYALPRTEGALDFAGSPQGPQIFCLRAFFRGKLPEMECCLQITTSKTHVGWLGGSVTIWWRWLETPSLPFSFIPAPFCAGDLGWRFSKGRSSLSSSIPAVFCPQQVVCGSYFFFFFCLLLLVPTSLVWPILPQAQWGSLFILQVHCGETRNSGFVLILKK